MAAFDPKLLEAYFRFMAELSKHSSQLSETVEALSQAASPEAWVKFMQQAAGENWLERYWQSLGLIPKARYDELEARYLELKAQLEAAEREAQQLRMLLKAQGNEATQAAVEAWSGALKQTLEAQTRWWEAWLKGRDDQ